MKRYIAVFLAAVLMVGCATSGTQFKSPCERDKTYCGEQ